jgi:uncharacterized protein (DUF58 family)
MSAIRGLTTRGRCLLAAGFAAAICALLLGEKDLLRVAILLLVLPMASVAVVARARFRLACVRSITPERIGVGQTTEVRLRLENVSLLTTSLLLLEDEVPFSLGSRPRFTAERLAPRQHRVVRYPLRSDVRGRFRVGPLRLRLTDPFGLVELTRSFSAVDRLTVVPATTPLPVVRIGGVWATGGAVTSRSVASRGEDDAATREYRHGDDLRKVHWRSTARMGKLMVRQVEKPWQNHATLLLDTRAAGHRGDGPGSSFEWAVSAAASIGVHLGRLGYSLDLFTDRGRAHRPGVDIGEEGVLLDYLAEVTTSRNRNLDAVLPGLRADAGGCLIAVLGSLGVDEARALAGVRPANDVNIALVLDVTTWVRLSPRAQQEAAEARDAAARELARSGWRVVHVDQGARMADVWTRAGERGGLGATSVGAT